MVRSRFWKKYQALFMPYAVRRLFSQKTPHFEKTRTGPGWTLLANCTVGLIAVCNLHWAENGRRAQGRFNFAAETHLSARHHILRKNLSQGSFQSLHPDWLGQMTGKSSLQAAGNVLLHPEAPEEGRPASRGASLHWARAVSFSDRPGARQYSIE